jgi:hypothetical protein
MVDTDLVLAQDGNPIVILKELHIKGKARDSEFIYCLAIRHISHDNLTVLVCKCHKFSAWRDSGSSYSFDGFFDITSKVINVKLIVSARAVADVDFLVFHRNIYLSHILKTDFELDLTCCYFTINANNLDIVSLSL